MKIYNGYSGKKISVSDIPLMGDFAKITGLNDGKFYVHVHVTNNPHGCNCYKCSPRSTASIDFVISQVNTASPLIGYLLAERSAK